MFIAVEGIDGCGKTTIITKIADFISTLGGKNIITTAEPQNEHISWSGKVLEIIMNKKISAKAQVMLINSVRYEHIDIIKSYLNNGYCVICDRFVYSTIAYQGFLMNCDIEYIQNIHKTFQNDFMPDLTFLLKIDSKIAQDRLKNRQNNSKFDNFDLDKMNILQKGYEFCKNNYNNTFEIDVNRSIDDIFRDIKKILETKLMNK